MESFIPLILIIIAYNVINTVIKAIRGGRNSAGESRPSFENRAIQPESKIKIWADEELFDDNSTEAVVTIDTYEDIAEDDYSYERDPVTEIVPARSIEAKPVKKSIYSKQAPEAGIRTVLSEKNSLLSAFIFHEVLKPPVTIRNKDRRYK